MTDAPTPVTESADEKKDRSDKLRKAYGEANTELRENHRDEFEALYVKHAAAVGIEYKPKPTKEQKAEAALAALLAANPGLKERLVEELAEKAPAKK